MRAAAEPVGLAPGPVDRHGRQPPSRPRRLERSTSPVRSPSVGALTQGALGGVLRRPATWRTAVAEGLADGLERLGPTFVKVGQLVVR
jgi:predicted unusual protein kinase regulating ubiquinone biosynthesis (AarF/ABC1/UbiB family)